MYETIEKSDDAVIEQYLNTHRWIDANVRNILDESDAILEPNYQLIYTVGKQLHPDGGSLRWSVTQALLKQVPYHINEIYQKWKEVKVADREPARVEFNEKDFKGRYSGFPQCRILDDSVFDELKSRLADDFLKKRLNIPFGEVNQESQHQLKILLTKKDLTNNEAPFNVFHNLLPRDQATIGILNGLLRFEVLKLALTKRWRVNYGVDSNGQRKMAIPFKAKDIPAEMSEFGHLDVAICFTQLSYYNSGAYFLVNLMNSFE